MYCNLSHQFLWWADETKEKRGGDLEGRDSLPGRCFVQTKELQHLQSREAAIIKSGEEFLCSVGGDDEKLTERNYNNVRCFKIGTSAWSIAINFAIRIT